jgi:hypothetical protein
MREPMVGSLIYGDHKIPKKTRPLKDRLKIPLIVALVFAFTGVVTYKFYNYREEGAVKQFLNEVFSGNTDTAFTRWDIEDGDSFSKRDFLTDWGPDGYYTKSVTSAKVVDSNSKGQSVIVYVDIETLNFPLAVRVDKESLKLSYSPTNKYRARASRQ